MQGDPVTTEVRKYRDEHAKKFGYDVRKIIADIKSREGQNGHPMIRQPVRPPPKAKSARRAKRSAA